MRGTLSQIKVLTKIRPQGEFTEGGAAPLEFSVNANCRPSPELDAKSKKVGRFVRQPTHVIWTELSAHGGDALLGICLGSGRWLRRQLKHRCLLTLT